VDPFACATSDRWTLDLQGFGNHFFLGIFSGIIVSLIDIFFGSHDKWFKFVYGT